MGLFSPTSTLKVRVDEIYMLKFSLPVGLPGARYYGGNEYIDQLEILCQKRALAAFDLDPKEWGVNVQPYSGSSANFEAFTALISPQDRIMGLDLPSGGHLTHGYQTAKKKISSSSIYFQSMPYQVDSKTGYIDYDRLEENARLYRPRIIVIGASAYPRDWDYTRLRKIADINQSYLMADVAHISGLIAGKQQLSPFEHADVVTTTTHKVLRGPRAGIIFFRRKTAHGETDLETRVNQAVFPSCQGGPHNNTIAGIAVALKQVASPEFRKYAEQVRKNAKALADALNGYGYKLVTGSTENHLVLWDLRPNKLTGSKVEKLCDMAQITINKNSVHGDVSAVSPGGVRIGASALTSRSFKEDDFRKVAEFLHRMVQLALEIQDASPSKKLQDFVAVANDSSKPFLAKIQAVREEVIAFATSFPMPGVDVKDIQTPAHEQAQATVNGV